MRRLSGPDAHREQLAWRARMLHVILLVIAIAIVVGIAIRGCQ